MALNTRLFDGMVIFVDVVRNGSFTAAATNSGHSTSYISKEISGLEERLGVRLLNRTTRSLSLTPEGESYFEECQQIIADAEEVENKLLGRQSKPSGTLKVSCPISFGLSIMRPIVAAYMDANPAVDLFLDLNDRKVDMIGEGFDVAVRATRQMEDSSLISRHVLRSRMLTIASPAYLERHGTPATPADLVSHKTITYSYIKQPNVWDYVMPDGKQTAVTLKCRVTTNSPQFELALAVADQGVVRLPAFNIGSEIDDGKLVELFTDLPHEYVDVSLVYPSRKHMSLKVRSFIDFVAVEMKKCRQID